MRLHQVLFAASAIGYVAVELALYFGERVMRATRVAT